MYTLNTNEKVKCPICGKGVIARTINQHIDSGCEKVESDSGETISSEQSDPKTNSVDVELNQSSDKITLAPIFSIGRKHARSAQAQPSGLSSGPTVADHGSSLKREMQEEDISIRRKRNKTNNLQNAAPIAERLRPKTMDEFVGQTHLTSPNSPFLSILAAESTESMIFWGPPGCGKTTLARLAAQYSNAAFKELSATIVGTNDVKLILEEAKRNLSLNARKTILFLDEIHRFNKAQQDIFLPYVEQGHIKLIGATTENPSFKLTRALLSRCRVFVLEPLSDDEIILILHNAMKATRSKNEIRSDYKQVGFEETSNLSEIPFPSSSATCVEDNSHLTSKTLATIASISAGDARTALSLLDLALKIPADSEEADVISMIKRSAAVSYDRTGDSHYDMISALHKSVRGSQGSAALYWLARMLSAGEDPLYIARRMVVCASEDIGLADNHALPLAMAAHRACQEIGMPECRINLAHIVSYLSEAPKSTRSYEGYKKAEEAARLDVGAPVPMQMRNAPTQLMKTLNYGKDYHYNPEYAHPVHNTYLPPRFDGAIFLKEPEEYEARKTWDEDVLKDWEKERNEGKEWEGRCYVDKMRTE